MRHLFRITHRLMGAYFMPPYSQSVDFFYFVYVFPLTTKKKKKNHVILYSNNKMKHSQVHCFYIIIKYFNTVIIYNNVSTWFFIISLKILWSLVLSTYFITLSLTNLCKIIFNLSNLFSLVIKRSSDFV